MENKRKIIEGFPNYEIDRLGNVYNYKTGAKLKPQKDSSGYLQVRLYRNGKGKLSLVNRIVAIAFIDNTEKKPQVNHINEIKTENRVENLNWMTHEENLNHGTINKRKSDKMSGTKHPQAKCKKHYATKATSRSDFGKTCKIKKWKFEEFEEVYSGQKNGRNKKYYYVEILR